MGWYRNRSHPVGHHDGGRPPGLLERLLHGWSARQSGRQRQRPQVEEYEPRLLYSADPAGFGMVLAGGGEVVEQRVIGAQGEYVASSAPDTAAMRHELLFVGAGVEDSDTLLNGLASDDRDIEVIVLDPERDSIAQITEALAARSDLSAIHILSHGGEGMLQLGATALDSAELASRAGEIGLWGEALQSDGDILLYGCDVAAGSTGAAFVRQLAALTGADVAASTNLTGAAQYQGDWVLEYQTDSIETGIAFTSAAQAQWGGLLETMVDSNPANIQNQSAVAVSASGNFVVVWTSDHAEDGDKHGVFGQLFNSSGDRLGTNFQVNTDFKDEQQNATVGFAADGTFVVAWASHSGLLGDANGWSIRAQRFQSDGVKAGSEFLVNQLTAGEQTLPSIAVAADGQFVIAWDSNQGNDVYLRHFDSAGNARSGDILVNTINTDGTQTSPQVAWAGNSYIVTWQSDRGGSGKAVFAQIMSSSDTPVGAGFQVNTYDANDQTSPVIAGNSSGAYVISWVSAGQDGTGNGVYAQLYKPVSGVTPSSVPYGAEFRVNTVTDKDQTSPSAAMDGSGSFLISWTSKGEDNGDTLGVYAQRYTANGTPSGTPFRVNTSTSQNQSLSVVAMNAAGSTAIAWEGNGVGDANGVFVANYVPANHPPVATPDIVSVTQDSHFISSAGGVLANDTDADAGAVLAVDAAMAKNADSPVAVTPQGVLISGTYGTLLIRSDGSYEYTAGAAARALAAGQTASDVFAYFIHDNNNAGSSSTLTFNVAGTNDGPAAVDDNYAVYKGSDVVVAAAGLLANDTDPDQVPTQDTLVVLAAFHAAASSLPGQNLRGQYGTLSFSANGAFSYSPDAQDSAIVGLQAGASLTDIFTYQIADSSGAVSSATLRIVILGKNTAPTAFNDGEYAVQQDGRLAVSALEGVLWNDIDSEGKSTLSAVVENRPSHGTLVLNTDGSFVYTPNPAYFGTDSFTYRTSDGSLLSNPATVTIGVSHVNHAPVAETDSVSLTQDTSVDVIASKGLLYNDTDVDGGDQLSVLAVQYGDSTLSVDPGSSVVLHSDYGVLTIASDGSYSYLANGPESKALGQGAASSDIFNYTISDGKGGTASATLVITITGANDAPTIGNATAGQEVNDNASLQPFNSVTIADIDSPAQQLTVTVSLDDPAKGSLSSTLGGAYSSGVYTYTGSADQVNAVVHSLTFTPTANRVAPLAKETTSFTLSVSDGTATASNAVTTVISTSINDAPVITGTAASQAVDDNATLSPFANVTIADADNPAQQLTVQVKLDSVVNGTLGNLGGGSYDAVFGVYTFTGTAAQATAALRALVFTPAANRVQPGTTETTTLTLIVSDGLSTSSDSTTTVISSSINDAPVVTGTAASQAVNDNASVSPFASVTIADADNPVQLLTVQVKLDSAVKGTLSNLGSGSYDAAFGVYTFTGTAAQATTALRGIVFTPTENRVLPGTTETTTLTLTISDGLSTSSDSTTTVISTSLNDAPVITGTAASQVVNDNASLSPFSGVTIADADSPAQQLTVQVKLDNAANGTLGNLGGGNYDAAGGVYTFIGTAAQATTALRGLVYSPTSNSVAPGTDVVTNFTLTVKDGLATITDTATSVLARSVNDAPVITGTISGQTVGDNASLRPFAGAAITDADNPAQSLTLRVTLDDPAKGGLSNLGGGSYDAATGVYTFIGTAAQVTTALRGLVFTPAANRLPPGVSETTGFAITAHDGQATGIDEVSSVISTSMNDAPVISGTLAVYSIGDNGNIRPFSTVVIADADQPAQQLTTRVTLDNPFKGILSNLGGGSYNTGTGVYTFVGSAAEATAALQGLLFNPAANRIAPGFIETTNLVITVDDGQVQTTNVSTTVTSTSINDTPVITGTVASQAGNDNAGVSPFAGVTIADADNPAQQLTVKVKLDNAFNGTLGNLGGGSYDAAFGVYTFTGTAAQATTALRALLFTPTANRMQPGTTETTTLTLTVSDGLSTSSDSSTTVVSTSINDAPVITGTAASQAVNDNASVPPFAGVTIADADNPAQQLTVQVKLDNAFNGTLGNLGGGSYDAAFGVYTFTGTAAQATAALRVLLFTPAANRVLPGTTETTTLTLIVSDGMSTSSDNATTVISASLNDAPVITGTVASQAVNDNAVVSPFGGVRIADADNPAQQLTVQVKLDSAVNGTLGNLGGGSYDAAFGVYTFTGTAAQATAALRGLVFTPTANRVLPGTNETTALMLTVSDGMSTSSDNTTTVISASVNDAPVITGAAASQAVNDNASLSLFSGITIADGDNPSQQLTVQVKLDSAVNGTLGSLGGGSYDAVLGVYTFTGTAAQATAALRGLVFTPTENRVLPGTAETTRFAISASDGIAVASGGAAAVASFSVNDAPTIRGMATDLLANDKSSTSPFANVTIEDADSPAQQLTAQVKLDSAAKGMLSSLGGGAYDAAAGIYRFTGTAAQATAALRGLVFTPTENRVTPNATETAFFTVALTDELGASADAAARVVTTSINDAPVVLAAAMAGTQETSTLLTVLLLADDADADALAIVIVDQPAHGMLYLDAAGTQPLSSGSTLPALGNAARVFFRPERGWAGETLFSYAAVDAQGSQGQPAAVRVSISPSILLPPPMPILPLVTATPSPAESPSQATDGTPEKSSTEKKPALLARATASEFTLQIMPAESATLALPAQDMPAAAVATASSRHADAGAKQLAVGFLAMRAADADSDNFVEVAALQSPALPASVLEQSRAAVRSESMMRGLDELRQSVKDSEEAEQRVVGATVAVGTSFSVGYVIWLLRGGVLATSLLSSLPAWRFVDPLPVLKQVMGEEEDEADDSLESIIGAGGTGGDDAARQAVQEGSK